MGTPHLQNNDRYCPIKRLTQIIKIRYGCIITIIKKKKILLVIMEKEII